MKVEEKSENNRKSNKQHPSSTCTHSRATYSDRLLDGQRLAESRESTWPPFRARLDRGVRQTTKKARRPTHIKGVGRDTNIMNITSSVLDAHWAGRTGACLRERARVDRGSHVAICARSNASQGTDDMGREGMSKFGKHGHSGGMSSCVETRSVAPFPTQSTHHRGLGD